MAESNVVPMSKNELLDIANITLVRFMYYCNRERIPMIASKLGLNADIVTRYLTVDVPKDEQLGHVIELINKKTFDCLTPMEELLTKLFSEITTEENVKVRSMLIGNYVAVSKNYATYLDMLKRVNSLQEAGNTVNFQFNILDQFGILPKDS